VLTHQLLARSSPGRADWAEDFVFGISSLSSTFVHLCRYCFWHLPYTLQLFLKRYVEFWRLEVQCSYCSAKYPRRWLFLIRILIRRNLTTIACMHVAKKATYRFYLQLIKLWNRKIPTISRHCRSDLAPEISHESGTWRLGQAINSLLKLLLPILISPESSTIHACYSFLLASDMSSIVSFHMQTCSGSRRWRQQRLAMLFWYFDPENSCACKVLRPIVRGPDPNSTQSSTYHRLPIHSWAHRLSLNGISFPLCTLDPSSSARQAQYSPSLTSAYDA